jgi:hypothetical protein
MTGVTHVLSAIERGDRRAGAEPLPPPASIRVNPGPIGLESRYGQSGRQSPRLR